MDEIPRIDDLQVERASLNAWNCRLAGYKVSGGRCCLDKTQTRPTARQASSLAGSKKAVSAGEFLD